MSRRCAFERSNDWSIDVMLPRIAANMIAPRRTTTDAKSFSPAVSGGIHAVFISVVSDQ